MHPERNGSISSSTVGPISITQDSNNILDTELEKEKRGKSDHTYEHTAKPSGPTETAALRMSHDDMVKSATEPLPHPVNPLGLHLLSHPSRGRGVFTDKDIPAGTLLEESPVLLLSKQEWEGGRMNDTILGEYGFCWPNGGMAIALGLGKSSYIFWITPYIQRRFSTTRHSRMSTLYGTPKTRQLRSEQSRASEQGRSCVSAMRQTNRSFGLWTRQRLQEPQSQK